MADPDWATPSTKMCTAYSLTVSEVQLSTEYGSIAFVPVLVADSSPLCANLEFHTAKMIAPSGKTILDTWIVDSEKVDRFHCNYRNRVIINCMLMPNLEKNINRII